MKKGTMDVSRRSFLGGALALTAATAVPLRAFANVPVIYGDGEHDDWAGLQAALDGKPFRVAGHGAYVVRSDGHIFIGNGSFKLSNTLHLRGPIPATLSDFRMEWTALPPAAPCIIFGANSRSVLTNGSIKGPNVPADAWAIRDDGWHLSPEHSHTCILVEASGTKFIPDR